MKEKKSLENAGFKVSTLQEFLGASDEEMKEINKEVERLFPRMTPFKRARRWVRMRLQKLRWGFNDDDLYDLDYQVAAFVLPRLKRLIEINKEEWFHNWATPEEFASMMAGFEEIIESGQTESDKSINAWRTFAEVIRGMWW